MKRYLLLPARFRWIGLALLIPFAFLGIMSLYHDFEFSWLAVSTPNKGIFHSQQNLTDELALSGTIVGLLFMSFARTRFEDEFIHSLRLEAWQWAVVINYAVLFVAIWAIYDEHFFYFMVYNMLTVLLIFLLRFHFLLYRHRSANN
jgi:hypothetical protein